MGAAEDRLGQRYGTVTPAGSATVAVLDTGVDASHPDLAGNARPRHLDPRRLERSSDPNGHGTAMAGIVAAETNNGEGIAGVGYAGVKVMPVTVLGADGTGQDSDVIDGVVWAADHGADVILMSFSNPGYSASLQAAVDYAWSNGAVLVAATGNDGSTAAAFPAGDRGRRSASRATTPVDALSGLDNYGADVFLGAPGVGIVTTAAGGGYGSVTGTSASAAIVAGAAAALLQCRLAAPRTASSSAGSLATRTRPAPRRPATAVNLARAADTATDCQAGRRSPGGWRRAVRWAVRRGQHHQHWRDTQRTEFRRRCPWRHAERHR